MRMSFGKLEQNNYDNEQQEKIIQETRVDLSDLKDQIASSMIFDDSEKNEIEDNIDTDVDKARISHEGLKTQVEASTNNDL